MSSQADFSGRTADLSRESDSVQMHASFVSTCKQVGNVEAIEYIIVPERLLCDNLLGNT
jgi:hypothetical protein